MNQIFEGMKNLLVQLRADLAWDCAFWLLIDSSFILRVGLCKLAPLKLKILEQVEISILEG